MTGPSDFTDEELRWIEAAKKVGVSIPASIENDLIQKGVIDRADLGPKITGLGKVVVDEAKKIGRLPKEN